MSVQMLPGWYDQIAPYVQQLSGIIPRLLNPNLDAQKLLQQQIAQDPTILQKLADLNANSPGLIDKLGFGNISAQIGKLPESYKNKTDKEASKAVDNLTPLQQQQRVAGLVGISTDDENERARLQQEVLKQNLQQGEQQLDEGTLRRQEHERIRALETGFDAWVKPRGKTNLYIARKNGEIPAELADAVIQSPKISKQYDQDAQDYFREEGLKLDRERLAITRRNDRMGFEEWKERSQWDQAEKQAYQVGSSHVDGFANLIKNPGLVGGFRQYDDKQLDEFAKQNPQLASSIAAYKDQKKYFDTKAEKDRQPLYNQLRIAHDKVRIAADRVRNDRGSELEVEDAISAYNSRLSEAQGMGINAGMLKWGKDPNATRDAFWTDKKKDDRPRIMKVDPTSGQVVGDGETDFEIKQGTDSEKFNKKLEQVKIDLVARSPQERKAILDGMAADTSATGKVVYQRISEHLKTTKMPVAGEIKAGNNKPTDPPKPRNPDLTNKAVASREAAKLKPYQAPPKKAEPPKPPTRGETLGDSAKMSKKTAKDFTSEMKSWSTAKKSEREFYLKTWKAEMSPADYAKLRYILGIKD